MTIIRDERKRRWARTCRHVRYYRYGHMALTPSDTDVEVK